MHQGARIGQRGDARALASGIPAALPQRWISLPLHNRSARRGRVQRRPAETTRGTLWRRRPIALRLPLISHALRSPYLVLPAGLEPAHGEETPKTHPRGAPSPRQHIRAALRRARLSSLRHPPSTSGSRPDLRHQPSVSGIRRPSPALALSLRHSPSISDARPQPPAILGHRRALAPSNVSPGAAAAGAPSAVRPRPLRLHRVRLSPVPRRTVKAQNSYDIGDWMQDP